MSKHHLAQALAQRGNAVVFVDPPRNSGRGIDMEEHDGVTVLRYRHWLRGVNRMPKGVNTWYYRRLIKRIAERTGGPFDIIWCFDTSRMQWFPQGVGYKLLHLADYDILYMGQGLIPTADIVFTTGQVVADAVASRTTAPTVNIGHALDERWMKGIDELVTHPARQPKRVVFAGQLANNYNDWEGFQEVAVGHPELSFTFIGPYDPQFPEPALQALRALPNVVFAGLKTKDELIPLLRAADILLFGFRSGRVTKERANPHKVLEYLSTGNVIVGSYTMEYVGRDGLMCLAEEGASLRERFDHAIAHFTDLNAPEARLKRIAVAKERTMEALIARIEQHLTGEWTR